MSYVHASENKYTVCAEVKKMNDAIHKEPAFGDRKTIHFPKRPCVVVTCPRCWTEQRADRDRCYHCGAAFVFINEAKQPENKGA